MNEKTAEKTALEMTAPGSATERSAGRPKNLWFRWSVAACLVLLAFSSYQQLQIQRRILARSQELKVAVAEAVAVSSATNRQLGGLRNLDWATAKVAAGLQQMVKSNAAIRNELAAMEGSVRSVGEAVTTLDRLTQESAAQLDGIARRSADLQSILERSSAKGQQVSAQLGDMARVQDEITANLGEMVGKTTPLQRFVKGE